jgi:hypothetical protein
MRAHAAPARAARSPQGVAYELADKGFIDSDETIVHRTNPGQSSAIRSGTLSNPHRMGTGSAAIDEDDEDEY